MTTNENIYRKAFELACTLFNQDLKELRGADITDEEMDKYAEIRERLPKMNAWLKANGYMERMQASFDSMMKNNLMGIHEISTMRRYANEYFSL